MSLTYPPCNLPWQDSANHRYSLDLMMEDLRAAEHIIRFDWVFKIILTLHTSHWRVKHLKCESWRGIKNDNNDFLTKMNKSPQKNE